MEEKSSNEWASLQNHQKEQSSQYKWICKTVMQTGNKSKGDPKTGSFQAYHVI